MIKNIINQLVNNKRLKSLLWRISMMGLAFLIQAIINNLTALQLSPEVTLFAGLVLGEISKAINNAIEELKYE